MSKPRMKPPVEDVSSDLTEQEQRPQLFKPGQSGNPAGRPKGSRNRLSEAFFNALEDSFDRDGVAVINKLMKDDPRTYTKIIAQLCPAKLESVIDVNVHSFDAAQSIPEVLEVVAKEAGLEAAEALAKLFGLEVSNDLADGIKVLPPPDVCINTGTYTAGGKVFPLRPDCRCSKCKKEPEE